MAIKRYKKSVLVLAVMCGLLFAIASDISGFFVNTSMAKDAVLWRASSSDLDKLNEAQVLVFSGINHSEENHLVVLRVDDTHNPKYHERVNIESWLAPGEFKLQLFTDALKTPMGRKLDWSQIIVMQLFQMQAGISIHSVDIQAFEALDEESYAWDLGSEDSPVFPGFSSLTPKYSGLDLFSAHLAANAVDRIHGHGDVLTDDGIKGIKSLTLDLPKGRWFVTLWIEEPGAWEYLPHPLERELSANGNNIWSEKLSAREWLNHRYLKSVDAVGDQPLEERSWDLFGRVQKVSFAVELVDDRLKLEWRGDTPSAGFVSAIVAEPYSDFRVRDKVIDQRKSLWTGRWPVQINSMDVESKINARNNKTSQIKILDKALVTVPDSQINIDMMLETHDWENTKIEIQAPKLRGLILDSELRFAHWQVKRTHLNNNALVAEQNYLSKFIARNLKANKQFAQLRVYIPSGSPPGRYTGSISLMGINGKTITQDFDIEVLGIALPALDKQVGLYHEASPHWQWFEVFKGLEEQSLRCDFNFLRRQGFTGIAPPLPTPNSSQNKSLFIDRLLTLKNSGFNQQVLAYAPLKRLVAEVGIEGASKIIADLERDILARGLLPPSWAIADEPSNPDQQILNDEGEVLEAKATRWARHLKTYRPAIDLAGQLNNPKDAQLLSAFSTVFINQGFGVSKASIAALKEKDIATHYYNMSQPRLAAGFYLWRSGAEGYLQWHARMPTAQPFNPTDGREDDIQLLLPSADACPNVMPVHKDLWRLSEGILDYRWMRWLAQQNSSDAKNLLKQIEEAIPADFDRAQHLSDCQLAYWRQQIMKLALQ